MYKYNTLSGGSLTCILKVYMPSHTHTHTRASMHTSTHIYRHTHTHTRASMHTSTHIYTDTHTHIHTHACKYAY